MRKCLRVGECYDCDENEKVVAVIMSIKSCGFKEICSMHKFTSDTRSSFAIITLRMYVGLENTGKGMSE